MGSSLLFFDTFSHEASNALQLDLVQFHLPVQVTEIRVIPLGAKVQADFPGGVRLGATNPSQFDIEFFVNDLSKRGAATFETIGNLGYTQHANIQLEFTKKTPTDGLLLRGNYNTITLAVYGKSTKVQREPSPKPPARSEPIAPPPEKVNTHERIRDWLEDTKVPKSPDFASAKQWDEDGKDARKRCSNEPEHVLDRSPSREKSWDRTDRASSRKANKRPASRESSFDKTRSVREPQKPRDWDEASDVARQKDPDYDKRLSRESYEKDSIHSRMRKKDEWDDRTSERSGLSPRRPRTPPMDPGETGRSSSPFVSYPNRESPRGDRRDWEKGSDKDADPETRDTPKDAEYRSREGSTKEWYAKKGKDRSKSRERDIAPPGRVPAILSDDMEAISDDEGLLDLPVEPMDTAHDTFNTEDSMQEPHAPDDADTDVFEYEDIMSDEEEMPLYQYEDEYVIDEWEDYVQHFSLDDLQHVPNFTHISSPILSAYQKSLSAAHKLRKSPTDDVSTQTEQGLKLVSLVRETEVPSTEGSANIAADKGETWVQAMEFVSQLLPSSLAYVSPCEEILDTLYTWVELGLNYDHALRQEQPLYKLRHIKAGIKLTHSLLQCAPLTTDKLLSIDVVGKLLTLLETPHMALSIKLLIIRSLDGVTSCAEGLHFIVHHRKPEEDSTYEKILHKLTTNQQSRVKVALSAIVRKIHLLEIGEKLFTDCRSLLDVLTTPSNTATVALEPAFSSIESCLKELMFYFEFANQLLVQSTTFLPSSKQFQLPKSNYDPYPYLYTIFDKTHVLEALSLLASTNFVARNAKLVSLIGDFVEKMMNTEHGLRFLACGSKATSLLIRGLLQYESLGRDEVSESRLQNLGMKLAFSIQAMSLLDCLSQIGGSYKTGGQEANFSEAAVHLNALHSMMLPAVGKEAIIGVLGHAQFLEILFPYLCVGQEEDHDKNPTKSACFGYAVELVVTTIKLCDDIALLRELAPTLTDILNYKDTIECKTEEYTKFTSILPFTSVVKAQHFSYDNIPQVTALVQESFEKLDKVPGELLSGLRILQHLSIGPSVTEPHHEEIIEELRFPSAIVRLFSEDFHTCLLNVLTRLCSLYQQPFLSSSNLVGVEGAMLIALLRPILCLLKAILSSVIESRNTGFKDLTAIVPLVQTYILLDSLGTSSVNARQLQQTIIDTFLCYTQPTYTTEGEEVLAKSLWTQMMAEIFKHLMDAPNTMVCVATIVTKLLPLNLPIYSFTPLTAEESAQAIRTRKLWSAHLYSLAPMIHEIIQRLGLGTHPFLTHSLRRMCVALSDLSAPMAMLIAKSVLDLLLQTHRYDQKHQPTFIPMTGQTTRVLNMMASLMSHAPTKAAVVHLMRGGSAALALPQAKSEEKYFGLVHIWCGILTSDTHNQYHSQSQEAIVMCLMHLLETHNTMQPAHHGLPAKEITMPFMDALVEVVRTVGSGSLAHLCVSFVTALLQNETARQYLKSCLDKKKAPLLGLFKHISCTWDNDSEGTFSLLKQALDLCITLIGCPDQSPPRTQIVTPFELSQYIGWNAKVGSTSEKGFVAAIKNEHEADPQDHCDVTVGDFQNDTASKLEEDLIDKSHPLVALEKKMVSPGEDEEFEFVYGDVVLLIETMIKVGSAQPEFTTTENVNLAQESLQNMFASRLVWCDSEQEVADPFDWLCPPAFEKLGESEVVRANLAETCRKYTESFDLTGALHKLVKGQTSQSLSPHKMSKLLPKYKQSATAIRPDKRGRPYVAPMRGRNFNRGMNIRSDPFRSRPPNTSRPPSLHVDDFVALESTGHRPTGPTGYNKISFGRGKMMLDSMRGGRGRARGSSDSRGRYFHRPPFRGEGSRGMRMRGSRAGWNFRGDSSRGSYRGSSGHFSRGRGSSGPYVRGAGVSKDRFQLKYADRGRRDVSSRGARNFH